MTKHDILRRQRIIEYIAATLRARGFPPSVREIAGAVGLASTSAVHHHLQILEREGYLERGAAQSRALRLTPTAALRHGMAGDVLSSVASDDAFRLPVIGEIAAGGPIEAYQDATETLSVPDVLAARGDAYVLRVRGESMIEEQIRDGDWVIVEDRKTADNGEMVIALVDGQDVTLKKFYKEHNRIRLQPANPTMQPIYVDPDGIQIQGVVVGVMRKY